MPSSANRRDLRQSAVLQFIAGQSVRFSLIVYCEIQSNSTWRSSYRFFPVFTDATFTVGITTGLRIGTSPAPGSCWCCIRVNISVRT